MVKAKLAIYYTFRELSVSPLVVEAIKWEDGSDLPLTTYKVDPVNPSYLGGCSCPAYKRDCKHMKCVEEARETQKVGSLHKWLWREKTGWEPVNDILDFGELLDGQDQE